METNHDELDDRKPIFHILYKDEMIATFYSESSMAFFLFCIGSEILGTTNKSFLNEFTKEEYTIVRAI